MDILISEKSGVRFLHFGSPWVQGAMRIAKPWALELKYTREMMACLLFRPEPRWPCKVLLIGLGSASLTKFLYKYRPHARLTVVEIASTVEMAARAHFHLPAASPRLSIIIEDGAQYIAQTPHIFDLILVDGFDENAKAGPLNSTQFYLNAKSKLAPQGLLVANILSRSKDFAPGIERLRTAFDEQIMILESADPGNRIAFASSQEPVECLLGDIKIAALALQKETGLNLQTTISRLEEQGHCQKGRFRI